MSATHLARIAEALSRPLLIHPTKAEIILSVLDGGLGRLGGGDVPALAEIEKATPEASRFLGKAEPGRSYRSQDGVAFIPIVGSLANRGAYIGASSGVVSYEGIGAQLRQAADDPSIHSIILDEDTPGGEATGMFRVAALVREIRKTKCVVAYVDDMAASAGYGIASQAHEIVISPTSIVGSIGVVLMHLDRSGEMEKAGRKVTLIHAGANKVDGHPFAPLSEQVKADLQREVMAFYQQFVDAVVAGRPGLTPDAVRATEARTYIGQEAIDRGLADRIASIDAVVEDLRSKRAPQSRGRTKEPTMSLSNSTHIQTDLDRARAEGAIAERQRIAAIINSDEGKANPAAALTLAFDEAALPVGTAINTLKALGPGQSTAKRLLSLDERMAENPIGLMMGGAPKRGSGLSAEIDKIIESNNRTSKALSR